MPIVDEWAYLCGGGCRTLFPWGDGLDYSMRLPCSPHCKPQVQEGNELNGDYDFYRPIIRVEMEV